MTPPAATAAAHRRAVRRGSVPRAPRRFSGPARPPRAALAGAAAARPPLAMRLGATAMRIGDARVLDRLVRGRGWIALLAIGLMGIVFMQVSLLKLNAGISRAVTAADTLERQNSSLRADISNLDSGERIQDVAATLGMTIPAAGDVHYLDGRQADGARAAASITPPDPVATTAPQEQVAAAPQQQAPATAQPQQAAPATTQQQAPVQQTPAQQTPAQQTAQPAATTAQQQQPAQTGAATTTAPPATSGAAVAGGATAPQGG
jgi:cell division protein FtsL